MNAFKNASYVGFVLYLIGIVLILYGLSNLAEERELDEKGIITQGKVYDITVIEPYHRANVKFKTKKR